MFVLSKSASYSWPVAVSLPTAGGKFETHTFDVTFKRLTQARIKEFVEKSEELGGDDSFCREVVVGWQGIVDEAGQQVPFSEMALAQLLDVPMVAKKIVTAYLESVSGAKIKN